MVENPGAVADECSGGEHGPGEVEKSSPCLKPAFLYFRIGHVTTGHFSSPWSSKGRRQTEQIPTVGVRVAMIASVLRRRQLRQEGSSPLPSRKAITAGGAATINCFNQFAPAKKPAWRSAFFSSSLSLCSIAENRPVTSEVKIEMASVRLFTRSFRTMSRSWSL